MILPHACVKTSAVATCLTALALLFLSGSVLAQEQRDTVFQIPAVTVTATRTPETLLEVPLAVQIVPAGPIRLSRRIGLEEPLSLVPGLLVQSRAGGLDARITVRGFGARGNGDRSNAGTIRGIRVLVDGFPVSEPDGRTSLDLVDLWSASSIEVIRSNSSALYGGASGGLINVRSGGDSSPPFVRAGAAAGSFGLHSESVQTGTMLGQGDLVFTLSNSTFDGWREHSRSSKATLNTALTVPLGEKSSLTTQILSTSNFFQLPGPLTRDQFNLAPRQADSTYAARDERRLNRIGRVGLRVDYGAGETHAVSVLAFGEEKVIERSERNTFRDFNRYHFGGSALYRLSLFPGEPVRSVTLLGVDEAYQNGSILFYNLVQGNRGTTLRQNKVEGANSLGLFAQEELAFGDAWSVIVGARFDILTYAADDNMNPSLAASKEFRAWSPKLGVSFRWRPGHAVYASLGGGLEAPAYNEVDPPPPFDTLTSLNPFLDPMKSQTFEIGAKGIAELSSPILRFVAYDLAGFLINVSDEIVPYDGGAYFLTAGRSRRLGAEVGLDLRSSFGLSLRGAGTILSGTYLTYANELGDFSGRDIPGVPDLSITALLRYDVRENLYIEFGARHTGKYFSDDSNSPEGGVSPATTLRAVVGGSLTSGPVVLDAYLGIENLADHSYVSSVFINGVPAGGSGAPRYFEPGLPRNILCGVTLRWNPRPS